MVAEPKDEPSKDLLISGFS